MSDLSENLVPPLRANPVLGVETLGDAVIVRLAGELDLYNADDVRAALAQAIAASPVRIVIDMSAVEFVDSTALGVLVEARSRLGHEALLLAALQPETRRTLKISGLDRHLAVHESVADALSA